MKHWRSLMFNLSPGEPGDLFACCKAYDCFIFALGIASLCSLGWPWNHDRSKLRTWRAPHGEDLIKQCHLDINPEKIARGHTLPPKWSEGSDNGYLIHVASQWEVCLSTHLAADMRQRDYFCFKPLTSKIDIADFGSIIQGSCNSIWNTFTYMYLFQLI